MSVTARAQGLPADRIAVLGEQLVPPPGYEPDALIATTFSLDFATALALPLSLMRYGEFAGFELTEIPVLARFAAFRRVKSRYRVFCQAGRIAAPSRRWTGISLLNEIVVPVQQRERDGISRSFHPKLVVARFRGTDAPSILRVVCMSRNLTTADALDVLVTVEGIETKRRRSDQGVSRLADALRMIPDLAVDADQGAQSRPLVDNVARSVECTSFDCPEPFEDVEFLPLGLGGPQLDPVLPGPAQRRLLVVSPFLRRQRLTELTVDDSTRNVLISESSEIDELDAGSRERFEQLLYLDPLQESEVPSDSPDDLLLAERRAATLATGTAEHQGLHAKLYIAEDASGYRWLIGSANATNSAVRGNAELLVQLRGSSEGLSIDSFLDPDSGIGELLHRWIAPARDQQPAVNELEETEHTIARLAQLAYIGYATQNQAGAYELSVEVDKPAPDLPAGEYAMRLAGSPAEPVPFDATRQLVAVISDVERRQLSAFLEIRVNLGAGEIARVVRMRLHGVSDEELHGNALRETADKMNAVEYLAEVIAGADHLGPPSLTYDDDEIEIQHDPGEAPSSGPSELVQPLLEPLMEFLRADRARPPQQRLMPELAEIIEAGHSRWPEHFELLWRAIAAAAR